MIKINLLAERKQAKVKKAPVKVDLGAGGKNIVLVGVLLVGVIVAGGWSYLASSELKGVKKDIRDAEAEITRLQPILEKTDRLQAKKDLFQQKIDLITQLKKQQSVPVHILDQVSRNLPDFLWLDRMTADANVVSIAGKATTYTAVSNFYRNLTTSGYFADVTLGRTFEIPEGVSFSMTCLFAPEGPSNRNASAGTQAAGHGPDALGS